MDFSRPKPPPLPGLTVRITDENWPLISLFLKLGLDLYLCNNLRIPVSDRRRYRLPSLDAIIAEAGARGHSKLTEHMFASFWGKKEHYHGTLVVFAFRQAWQHNLLFAARGRAMNKARLMSIEKLSLFDLILYGSVWDIRLRVRMVAATRRIQGIPVDPAYLRSAQQTEIWSRQEHNYHWALCYDRITTTLGICTPAGFATRLADFAAASANDMAQQAYLAQEADPTGPPQADIYGRKLAERLVRYFLAVELPHVDFYRPWDCTAEDGMA